MAKVGERGRHVGDGAQPKRFQFAFAGGGANFLAHLRLIESLQSDRFRKRIAVTRAAGTSAGAIAAALLALGLRAESVRAAIKANESSFVGLFPPPRFRGAAILFSLALAIVSAVCFWLWFLGAEWLFSLALSQGRLSPCGPSGCRPEENAFMLCDALVGVLSAFASVALVVFLRGFIMPDQVGWWRTLVARLKVTTGYVVLVLCFVAGFPLSLLGLLFLSWLFQEFTRRSFGGSLEGHLLDVLEDAIARDAAAKTERRIVPLTIIATDLNAAAAIEKTYSVEELSALWGARRA